MIIKPNGQIDKRSLRFLGKAKGRRRLAGQGAARDAEGYLLKADGTRNQRSVSIINSLKSKDRGESEAPGQK